MNQLRPKALRQAEYFLSLALGLAGFSVQFFTSQKVLAIIWIVIASLSFLCVLLLMVFWISQNKRLERLTQKIVSITDVNHYLLFLGVTGLGSSLIQREQKLPGITIVLIALTFLVWFVADNLGARARLAK